MATHTDRKRTDKSAWFLDQVEASCDVVTRHVHRQYFVVIAALKLLLGSRRIAAATIFGPASIRAGQVPNPLSQRRCWHSTRDFGNAARDPVGGGFQRVVRQVRVSRGCLHLVVTKQFPNHGKPFPDQKTATRVAVPKIVQLNISQIRKRCCVPTEYRQQRCLRSAPQPREQSRAPGGRNVLSSR